MKLDVKAMAIAAGIFWGVVVFLLTWWIILQGDADGERLIIGLVYPGYRVSPVGSLIGLGYGLVDGFIAGGALAWLYNFILARCRKDTAPAAPGVDEG